MAEKLTDALVKKWPLPTGKNPDFIRDTDVKGFGVRVTPAGARSFILNYRTRNGRDRRITIGSFPDWSTAVAREEAKELKRQVDRGEDPMAELEADRNAKTIGDLCDRFIADHLPKRRPATIRDYTLIINNEIRPALKHELVAELRHDKVDELHRRITKTGKKTKANRAVAVLSKMLNDAAKWGWRSGDNPARGIEKNAETKRKTYLKPIEIARLGAALDAYPTRQRKDGTSYVDARAQQSANVIRLLMLTGARSGELLGSSIVVEGKRFDKEGVRWDQFDLTTGIWVKPGSTTKQKTEHVVHLNAPALKLLASIRAEADRQATRTKKPVSDYVFPGHGGKPYLTEIKKAWAEILKAAEITNFRVHDLRHTYASVLVSAGQSLPVIGALLGHSQAATTARYAHLMDDPLKRATETAGAILSGKPSAEIVPLEGRAS